MARYAPLVPLVAGALLLIVAEFVTVREIKAVTVVPPGGTETGGGLHGYALGLIGVAILVMSYGAVVRGARCRGRDAYPSRLSPSRARTRHPSRT